MKFRAECSTDVDSLMELIPKIEIISITKEPLKGGFPDVVVTLNLRTIKLERLKSLIRKVEDCHTMLQTVNYLEEYTGKRDYSIVV